jgi:hypothetical protein
MRDKCRAVLRAHLRRNRARTWLAANAPIARRNGKTRATMALFEYHRRVFWSSVKQIMEAVDGR